MSRSDTNETVSTQSLNVLPKLNLPRPKSSIYGINKRKSKFAPCENSEDSDSKNSMKFNMHSSQNNSISNSEMKSMLTKL